MNNKIGAIILYVSKIESYFTMEVAINRIKMASVIQIMGLKVSLFIVCLPVSIHKEKITKIPRMMSAKR